MKTEEEVSEWLVSYMAKLAAMSPEEIDLTQPFSSYGIDSTAAAGLSGDLGKWLGLTLKDSVAFDHPTIQGLSAHVVERLRAQR